MEPTEKKFDAAQNAALITRLREQIEDRPPQSDLDFLMVGPSAGLLCGLTDDELHPSLADFVRAHGDASSLMMTGLGEIEHSFREAVGRDLSLPVILTQKWVLLAEAVSEALRPTGIRLSDGFWLCLGEIEDIARNAALPLDAAQSIEDWRDTTQLPAEKQIAAVETVLTDVDQALLDALALTSYRQRHTTTQGRRR